MVTAWTVALLGISIVQPVVGTEARAMICRREGRSEDAMQQRRLPVTVSATTTMQHITQFTTKGTHTQITVQRVHSSKYAAHSADVVVPGVVMHFLSLYAPDPPDTSALTVKQYSVECTRDSVILLSEAAIVYFRPVAMFSTVTVYLTPPALAMVS